MDRTRLLPQIPSLSSFLLLFFLIQCQVWCLHIRPEPCQNSMGDIGTCMFVWECIKTEGKHLGTCADGFLFGSCCAHNDSKNNIIPSDSDATTQSHKETTPSLPLSKQTSTGFHSSTTSSSHSSFESPSISHFSSKPFHFKPSSTTFRPIFTSPSFKPASTLKPVHIKTTLKPFSTTLKLSYTRPPFKPSSIVNSTNKVRPSFKPTTNVKPPFIKPLSKPFSTTTKLEFIWSTSNLESTTSRPVYVRPTHKTTFKPIFVRPTTKPHKPTIVYPPMSTGSNSSMGNFSSAIKTTNKPPLKSTTKKYGFISSTHKWAQPTSFQPSHISTKKPYFPPRTSTIHQPSVAHWTSNYSYSRPSWKPTLKPTSIFTSNPFIYTYSTNNYATRPSFTPFATRSTRPPTPSSSVYHTTLSVKPSFDHVTTFNYSTDITTAFEQTMNVTINENFFTTHRPFTTSRQTTSNQKPFSPSTFEYFTQQSSNHGWFYPQYNKSTTVTSPTTSFFTSQENSTLSNVSTPEGFISEGTHHTSEAVSLSTFMVSHPFDLSSEAVTLTEEKTTTPFPVTPCGTPRPHPKQKVVGGKNSAFGSWPWQASVRRTSFFGFSSTHRCGGALISREWVATAGHCVDDLLIGQIKIRVGEYDFASIQEPHGYVERGIVKKVVHPRYNFFTYENDLALIKLEEAIDLTKHPHISPICLPPNEENLIGKNATVTGWGRLSEGGVLPSILQEVQVPIISNEKCKNMFLAAGRHEYIPDIFLCAGFEEGGRDSCQGDSGGPLQIKTDEGYWYLAGIISWGIGCAEPNMPGVCTRISKFKDWVVKQIT